MDVQILVPEPEKVLQSLDQNCATISRLVLGKEKVLPPIRRSHSAQFYRSRMEDDQLDVTLDFKINQYSGRNAVHVRSGINNKRRMSEEIMDRGQKIIQEGVQILPSTIETGLDFSIPIIAPVPSSPEPLDSSANNNRNYERDYGELPPLDFKNSFHSVLWVKVQAELTFPIHLKFSDISYKVSQKGSSSPNATKYILQGVSGSAKPGEFLALIGPSGAGKTTLLNILSGRIKCKDQNSSITYNGESFSKSLKKRIGFVQQDDIVFPHLTVKETLSYAARLRLPTTLTKQQKEERAMHVIMELGLERCQDTVIGGPYARGISGGERKRLCIGNEILLNPPLLFLDEPTSGLDSTTALRIVQTLHDMAHAGRTVVTTIHQPSSRSFNMFDKLILLGKGRSLYFGKASEAMIYFNSIGCSPTIAMNPAEFLIDLANGNTSDISIPSQLKNNFICQKKSPSSMNIHEYLNGAHKNKMAYIEKQESLKFVETDTRFKMQNCFTLKESRIGWLEQHQILFCRGFKERRHESLNYMRVTQVLSIAVIIGLLWWHSDDSTAENLQDQAGLLFFISVFWSYFPVFTAIFTFPQERAMLAKERSADMYQLSAYFIARNLSDLLLDLILPTLFLLIVYFTAGLKPFFSVFLRSMVTIFISIIAAQGLGLAIGAALMDVKKATTLASVTIMTFMLCGGFFIQNVPFYISWIRYFSINYHTYRLLLLVQYGCPHCTNFISSHSTTAFLKKLRLDNGYTEVISLITMVLGYRILAFLFLRNMKLKFT